MDPGPPQGGGAANQAQPSGEEAAGSRPAGAAPGPPSAGPSTTPLGVEGRCRYTRLPRVLKQQGATPAQLTAWNLDKTKLVQEV